MKLEHCFSLAKDAMNLAPMLCILFYAARMRALQIFPEEVHQQSWAKTSQYFCSIALVIKAIATVVIPLSDSGAIRDKGSSAGEAMYNLSSPSLKLVSCILRGCLALCVYTGSFAVVVSISTLHSPHGVAHTPPLSDTLVCLLVLQNIYFVVYLSVFIIHSVRDFLPSKKIVHRLAGIFEAGRHDVMFAPMLCLLMLATRMRALQLTRTVDGTIPAHAGPQAYVKEAMHMATWAILVPLVMTYLSALFMGTGVNFPEEQPPAPKGMQSALLIFDMVKYLSLALLYGCVIAIMNGAFTMTPETLSPYAA